MKIARGRRTSFVVGVGPGDRRGGRVVVGAGPGDSAGRVVGGAGPAGDNGSRVVGGAGPSDSGGSLVGRKLQLASEGIASLDMIPRNGTSHGRSLSLHRYCNLSPLLTVIGSFLLYHGQSCVVVTLEHRFFFDTYFAECLPQDWFHQTPEQPNNNVRVLL